MEVLKGLGEGLKNAGAQALGHAQAAREKLQESAALAQQKISGRMNSNEEDIAGKMLPTQGHFVVEIVKAMDVPKCDLFSESDPFVTLHIAVNNGTYVRVSEVHRTVVKADNNAPVWHSFACLRCTPPVDSFVTICLYDSDDERSKLFKAKTLLGTARIPVAELSEDEEVHDFPLNFHKHGDKEQHPNFKISLRRAFLSNPPPETKTFFLIRHGESKWNKAEKDKNLGALIGLDHGLTLEGVNQARQLSDWISQQSKEGKTTTAAPGPIQDSDLSSQFDQGRMRAKYLDSFFNADAFYSSPLTRTVQTAFAALHTHPHLQSKGLHLYSVIREVKSIFGLDSVGTHTGDAIAAHARAEVETLLGADTAKRITAAPVGSLDCDSAWWTPAVHHDSDADIAERHAEFLSFARCNGAAAAVYVGHSLFFKSLCARHAGAALDRNRPALAARLRRHKLGNGALLAVTVHYPPDGPPVIHDAELLFGGFAGGDADSPGEGAPAAAEAAAAAAGEEETPADGVVSPAAECAAAPTAKSS